MLQIGLDNMVLVCAWFWCPDPNRLPSDTGFVWSSGSNIVSTTIAINQMINTGSSSS